MVLPLVGSGGKGELHYLWGSAARGAGYSPALLIILLAVQLVGVPEFAEDLLLFPPIEAL